MNLIFSSIAHDEWKDQDPNQVFYMLMKNFNRTYRGEEYLGVFEEGNRAPWGLYMHAAWFFGRDWHFQGYKMFIDVSRTKSITETICKTMVSRKSRVTLTCGSFLWRRGSHTWRPLLLDSTARPMRSSCLQGRVVGLLPART